MYTESPPTDNIYPTNIAQPAPGNLDPTRKFYVTPRTIYPAPRPDPTYIDPGGCVFIFEIERKAKQAEST